MCRMKFGAQAETLTRCAKKSRPPFGGRATFILQIFLGRTYNFRLEALRTLRRTQNLLRRVRMVCAPWPCVTNRRLASFWPCFTNRALCNAVCAPWPCTANRRLVSLGPASPTMSRWALPCATNPESVTIFHELQGGRCDLNHTSSNRRAGC